MKKAPTELQTLHAVYAGGVRLTSPYQYVMRIAQSIHSKVIKGVPKFGHVTEFEADRSVRSKVIRGSQHLPHCRPLPGGMGWTKFNHLEMVTSFT